MPLSDTVVKLLSNEEDAKQLLKFRAFTECETYMSMISNAKNSNDVERIINKLKENTEETMSRLRFFHLQYLKKEQNIKKEV